MATTYELIASQTLGADAATVVFNSIPATFDDLVLQFSARTSLSAAVGLVSINFNNTNLGFTSRHLRGNGSSASSASYSGTTYGPFIGYVTGNTATSNTFGVAEVYIPNYTSSSNKSFSSFVTQENNATSSQIGVVASLWANTSVINEIKIYDSENAANLKAGSSFYLYGITKA